MSRRRMGPVYTSSGKEVKGMQAHHKKIKVEVCVMIMLGVDVPT